MADCDIVDGVDGVDGAACAGTESGRSRTYNRKHPGNRKRPGETDRRMACLRKSCFSSFERHVPLACFYNSFCTHPSTTQTQSRPPLKHNNATVHREAIKFHFVSDCTLSAKNNTYSDPLTPDSLLALFAHTVTQPDIFPAQHPGVHAYEYDAARPFSPFPQRLVLVAHQRRQEEFYRAALAGLDLGGDRHAGGKRGRSRLCQRLQPVRLSCRRPCCVAHQGIMGRNPGVTGLPGRFACLSDRQHRGFWISLADVLALSSIYDLQINPGHRSIKTTEQYLDYLTPEEQRNVKYTSAQKSARV